jgi:predicted permease
VRRDAVIEDIEAEMRLHVEMEAQTNIGRGMKPKEARLAALRSFGNLGRFREIGYEIRGGGLMDTLWQDLRLAARLLLKNRGLTAVAVITLALGIGANTAIFTLINLVMLKSLPVSHPEELVMVAQVGELDSGDASAIMQRQLSKKSIISRPVWELIRDQQDVFAGVFAYGSTGSADLSTGGEARPVSLGLVTGGFFTTLGVRPLLGRTLTDDDDKEGCAAVAVITHAFWQSEYGGREDVVGQRLAINGHPFQIVGVTAPAFFGVEFGYNVPIWTTQCAGPIIRGPGAYRGGGWVIGRLKPGVRLEQARASLAALAPGIMAATVPPNLTAEAAARYQSSTLDVIPFSMGIQFLRERYGQALFILMALVGLVLLIACANVASLLLGRATARQHEIAVRLALGASRARLIRQLLTESILLSLAGAALGVMFAAWASRVLVGLLSKTVWLSLAPDPTVLGFTIAVGILTGVIFGLAPAWRSTRSRPYLAMKANDRMVPEGHSRFRLGNALVVAQVALSLVMIACAGLLLGSWRRLAGLDPGFRSDGVLLVRVNTRPAQIEADQRGVIFNRILERLRELPGVAHASAADLTPFDNTSMEVVIQVPGFNPVSEDEAAVRLNRVSDGYFASMGVSILGGRDFNSGDVSTSRPVAIVNEQMARKFFGDRPAIGQHFRAGGFSGPVEVIGIAADTKESSLDEASQPIVYCALSQRTQLEQSINFALRTGGSPSLLIPGVKATFAEIEPRLSLSIRTLQNQVAESVRVPRALGLLSGFFGALALLLAAIGLYGIISYSVARRQNEIGLRIALGATRTRVIRMVLGDVAVIVVTGIALGGLASLAATRLVAAFLYGVAPNDPSTLGLSAVTLVAVAIGAALIPAWRAARLDPMAALRYE